jgi:type IV secretion system protein VirD4
VTPAFSLKIGAAAALYLAVFVALASILLVVAGGMLDDYEFPAVLWQWPVYAWQYGGDSEIAPWLAGTGLPAGILPLVLSGMIYWRWSRRIRGWTLRRDFPTSRFPRRPIRSTTDNYGHARWATLAEARQLWRGPTPLYGGIVVGEAYDPRQDSGRFRPSEPRSWGCGGQTPLLIDPCDEGSTHSILVSGSGGFKTVCAASTLCTWRGPAVVLDPATELGPMLKTERERMGHRVHILSPENAAAVGFNALDWIDITSPVAETDISAVVEWVCGYTARRDQTAQFFKDQGKALVTCLLAHMLWDDSLFPEFKTLRFLREMISVPEKELKKALEQIHRASPSTLARHLAGPLYQLVDETFSGGFANANEDTRWLATQTYADLVSGSTFRTSDICRGNTDVFISLPLKSLEATPAVARCIIGALINAVYEANGAVQGRVLFLLDEAARLGYMNVIRVARDAGRKFGITLHLLYQAVGQIEGQWGKEGKNEWYEGVAWRAYAAVKDYDTAKELADTIGQHGALGWSESTSTNGSFFRVRSGWGRNTTYTELPHALMRPEEIMHDLRSDAQIVIAKGLRPALTGRAIYFRRPELVAKIGVNRFARSETEGVS